MKLIVAAIMSSIVALAALLPEAIAQQTTGTSTKSAPATTSGRKSPSTAVSSNESRTEAQAKARCPSHTVVWANLKSKVYHFTGTNGYAKTKSGAYMCEKDATAQGFRASKGEKHPAKPMLMTRPALAAGPFFRSDQSS